MIVKGIKVNCQNYKKKGIDAIFEKNHNKKQKKILQLSNYMHHCTDTPIYEYYNVFDYYHFF